jgi:peptide/nickel transport system substrate-binding protein/oligopeptide transport system substrate-binding protein
LQLSYISGAGQEEVVQLIQADLKNIGITVDLDGSDGPTFSDKVYGGKFQMARDAWTADYPIADNFLYPIFGSASDSNVLGYSNAAVDQGILAARQILDPAARAVAYEKVSATIGNDSPVAPIYAYRHRSVCSARLHNFTYSPLCLSDFVSCWISTQ